MRWATLFATLLLTLTFSAIGVRWALNTGSASPGNTLTCEIKPACDADEVEVLRMSAKTNAHAGTPAGSAYDQVLCCGGVHNLSTGCSAVYDAVLTLSATDNAHVAADGSYATPICLSVPHGVSDCTYGLSCDTDYQCLATVSGSSNAHVADCDGVDDYETKVCCYVEDDNDNDAMLDPDDPDDDNDSQGLGDPLLFRDEVEAFMGTDPWDGCPDNPSDPAWPPDFNNSTKVTSGDLVLFRLHYVPLGGAYDARYDLNASGAITSGDLVIFSKYYVGSGYDTCVP